MKPTTNAREAAFRLAAHLGVGVDSDGATMRLTFPSGKGYSGPVLACVGTLYRYATTPQPAGLGRAQNELQSAVQYAATDKDIARVRGHDHDRAVLRALRIKAVAV